MFVAWRDLRRARGRFALITVVVGLITVLVTFLAGLTGGLAMQNISAVLDLPAQNVVFASEDDPDFAQSQFSEDLAGQVTSAYPDARAVGISQLRMNAAKDDAEESSSTAVSIIAGLSDPDTSAGQVMISDEVADDLALAVGDEVDLGTQTFTVASTTTTEWFSHTPVVYLDLSDWQQLQHAIGRGDAYAWVILTDADADADADVDVDVDGTRSTSLLGSLTAVGSFRSEIGSLALMDSLLFGISALVVGAFFTVWTMQRTGDIAVLKALGSSTAALLRDSVGQAALVLALGIGLGTALVALIGTLVSSVLPFLLSPLTSALPAAIMILLGLAGAAVSLRAVTRTDPLTALGTSR